MIGARIVEYQRGRPQDQRSRRGTETFTGDVMLDLVLGSGNVMMNSVFFQPGGRTYWHSHGEGQVLLVGHGRGMVETRAGQRRVIQAGDAVYAPPGEEHWHGAAPDSFLLHTAISIGRTQWLDEVKDERYSDAWEKAALEEG